MEKVKVKEIYRSEFHKDGKSHDVCVMQRTDVVKGVKLKMTYECYKAVVKFTGDLFNGGEWTHCFSMLDLGESSDSSSYIWDNKKRLLRAESLITKGIDFFKMIQG